MISDMTNTELMALDPLSLTIEERSEQADRVIEYYRKRREQFNLGVKNAGSTKRLDEPINLEDLGL